MNQISAPLWLSPIWSAEIYKQWDLPEEVTEKWNILARSAGEFGIFIGHGWFKNFWRSFGASGNLVLIVLKQDGVIRAIFPCCLKPNDDDSKLRSNIASLCNAHTPYYDFIIDPEIRQIALSYFRQVLRHIFPESKVVLDYLPAGGPNTDLLAHELWRNWSPVHISRSQWAPWMEVTGDWERLCCSLPSRLRNTLRRCWKKAEGKGRLRFEVFRDCDNVDTILKEFFNIEFRGWKGAQGTAIMCQDEVISFYRRLAYWANEGMHLLMFALRLDEVLIAAQLCLRFGGTVFLLKTAYDESYRTLSPGTLLQHEVLKYLFGVPEVRNYNFLGACDRWKMEWTNNCSVTSSMIAYPGSMRGWRDYAFEHGWKDVLRRVPALPRIRQWMTSETDRRLREPHPAIGTKTQHG
ncbi:MAG: GNAT family N-acetyltransferase [Nitrospirae bacterium]|nr:MAG: GNAT family N-acetyltransferase [Nitrospirota bacterium]